MIYQPAPLPTEARSEVLCTEMSRGFALVADALDARKDMARQTWWLSLPHAGMGWYGHSPARRHHVQ